MSEEKLNEMLENIENAFWYLKNCKCNVDVTTKGHKWETYYGLDNDLIDYIRKIEKQLQQKESIIKEVREYITSYESISTIQGLEDIEANKDLDEKTLNEMVRRYMIVHDELLKILDKADKGE